MKTNLSRIVGVSVILRNKDKDKGYAVKAESIIKETFPSGMQKIDATQLKAPPAVGLRIKNVGSQNSFLG